MSAGYIYVLINKSLEGLIKIGSTTLGAKEIPASWTRD